MKKLHVFKDCNQDELMGSVSVNKKAEDLLSTGEWIIVPSYVKQENGNRLVQLALIHENTLVKEDAES